MDANGQVPDHDKALIWLFVLVLTASPFLSNYLSFPSTVGEILIRLFIKKMEEPFDRLSLESRPFLLITRLWKLNI